MTTEGFSRGTISPGRGLTAPAFERLLAALAPDRESAASEYERLHERVSGLLRWWGSPWAAELADETLDRVARKLHQGVEIRDGALGAYVRGVARLVFHESKRRMVEDPLPGDAVSPPPSDDEKERSLSCLDRCLAELSPEERDCVLRYYDTSGGRAIDARRDLARSLGLSPTALRIRTHRLRQRLERCVAACMEER